MNTVETPADETYECIVVVPAPGNALLPLIWSPVLIPVIESKTIADVPDPTVATTVLLLVTSPIFIIGSFNDVFVELTVVVVPSTCKLPLIITIPSLSKPSGYGSMNKVFPPPGLLLITLDEIPILSTIRPSAPGFIISTGTSL